MAARLAASMIVLYVCLATTAMGIVPWWVCALVSGVLTARYIGYSHALVHRTSARTPLLYEFLFPALTPLMPGFGQLREVHLRHHATATARDDPERWAVSPTSSIAVLIRCAFMYEWWAVYALRHVPMSRGRWAGLVGRAILFGALALGIDPWIFVLGHLAPARLAIATGFWRVSLRAHYSNGVAGSFDLADSGPIRLLRDVVVGRYATDTIRYHARHHARPGVSILALRSGDPTPPA